MLRVFHFLPRLWRCFSARENGSTAIEFTLMAVPFSIIMVGMIEMGMMFTASALLEGATQDAARKVRTGQVQKESDPEEAFKTALCDHASVFFRCEDIKYEVTHLRDDSFFAAADVEAQFDKDGNLVARPFDAGIENSVTLVRVTYRYPIMTPLFGQIMSDKGDNKKLLMATVIMQNEPYDF